MQTVTHLCGKPVTSLEKGDWVKAMTLFGWATVKVNEIYLDDAYGDKSAVAYSKNGGLGVFLTKIKGQEEWEAGCAFNPEAICKVQFV